jgi:hypothetical protein
MYVRAYTRSGHYVRTSQDGTGIMFLAEAALGTYSQKYTLEWLYMVSTLGR